jgi:hypothetical protein
MRITEVELAREMRDMREFTISDLMRRTGAPKTLTRRTVLKLIEKGLVVDTGRFIPAAGGLGGRGKPARVYRYVGDQAQNRSSS